MTDRIEDINKAIVYEIITAMGDDKLNALLTADDLLASMAVPVTQFDFTYVDKGRLNKLMLAVYDFIRKSKLSVNSYTKEGLKAKFDSLWVPTLSKEQKQEMIADYRLVDGFDEDGYAIFNAKNYNSWKAIFDKGQIPRFEYKRPQFGKGSKAIELIDDRPFTIYRSENIDGYWCVPLEITVDLWVQIIRGASNGIKRMLQCYLQVTEPNRRVPLQELEKRFGIKWESFNACNTALGRRAQKMLNFAVVDQDGVSRCWSTAMTRGRSENGLWVWEPRPELMEAAEKVLREEKFPPIQLYDPMPERRLNGIWNADRLLQNLLRFTDDRGKIRSLNLSDDSPYGIEVRRFAAAMKAYGKDECLYQRIEYVISEICSEEKINELCQLLSQNLPDKYSTAFVKPDNLKGLEERQDLFEALFRYRKSLYQVENIWSGMRECSHAVALGIKATNSLYQTHIKIASDILDRLLVLLMGDDYDRSFSEEKFLPFGYPNVTDEELEDMILDNW